MYVCALQRSVDDRIPASTLTQATACICLAPLIQKTDEEQDDGARGVERKAGKSGRVPRMRGEDPCRDTDVHDDDPSEHSAGTMMLF